MILMFIGAIITALGYVLLSVDGIMNGNVLMPLIFFLTAAFGVWQGYLRWQNALG